MRWLWLALLLAGCADPDVSLLRGPATRSISVVQRSWHTQLCVAAPAAATDPLAPIAAGFPGARFLCFGFGERQWLVLSRHDPAEAISALFPSRAAVLMTVLRAPPVVAYGAEDAVTLDVPQASEAALRRFLRDGIVTDAAGRPERLRDGPYPGSVFFAATGTYDLFNTCNSWTADGLRHAGFPIEGPAVFAGPVMHQVRQIAATGRR